MKLTLTKEPKALKTPIDLVVGGFARANLLPPEVAQGVAGKKLRRNLVFGVVLAAVVVLLGFAGASVIALQSQANLDLASARTGELIAEQSKYVEVRQVTGALDVATNARVIGSSTEINWKSYIDQIEATLPAGTTVTNFAADTATPMTRYSDPTGPLQGERMGEITFTANSASLPDVKAWLEALEGLTGYVDAFPGSVALDETTNGYSVSIVMHINSDALSNRFAEQEVEGQ
jgi:hypothetical protein